MLLRGRRALLTAPVEAAAAAHEPRRGRIWRQLRPSRRRSATARGRGARRSVNSLTYVECFVTDDDIDDVLSEAETDVDYAEMYFLAEPLLFR